MLGFRLYILQYSILEGTIDIVVHKIIEDGTLAEVYRASGGDWGGTIVDKEFKAFVKKLFNNEQCFNQLWEIAPRDALEFEREFEAKKRQFSDDDDDDIRLRLPDRLKMFANVELGDQKNDSITFSHMYVKNKEFREFFKTARDKIIEIIENIFSEVGNFDFIILVGGFSCSHFLQKEIKRHHRFSSIKFIFPKDPDTVVLQGAVLFGYNPRAVTARICRYTYGIRINRPFDSKIHPESKRRIIDGEEKCIDVFNVLVYKDELVKYDEVKTEELYSTHRNKDRKFVSIEIELFQAKNVVKGQLTLVTDEGFQSIGKIVCKPPENGWPDRVDYTAKIYFGQTNIRIETYETANKVPMKTSFELD